MEKESLIAGYRYLDKKVSILKLVEHHYEIRFISITRKSAHTVYIVNNESLCTIMVRNIDYSIKSQKLLHTLHAYCTCTI